MIVIRKDTGHEIFRGSMDGAKRVYGAGIGYFDRVVVTNEETGETTVVSEGVEVELELQYEFGYRDECLAYLADTDWYVARFAETGKAIPETVVANRALIRQNMPA